MNHSHHWLTLYKVPTDTRFWYVYQKTKLGQWFICECGVVGRSRNGGKIRPIQEKQQATRLVDAQRWNQSLDTWITNLKEIS
jgi:hypothetical protein